MGGAHLWVSAASAEEIMAQANENYTRGEYSAAIEFYRLAIRD